MTSIKGDVEERERIRGNRTWWAFPLLSLLFVSLLVSSKLLVQGALLDISRLGFSSLEPRHTLYQGLIAWSHEKHICFSAQAVLHSPPGSPRTVAWVDFASLCIPSTQNKAAQWLMLSWDTYRPLVCAQCTSGFYKSGNEKHKNSCPL